ncbi:unnamed protein product [Cuscuta campestris]|uniref:Rubisco accumulation factor 1 C-terminal domain-containing protein n=1 Tax=Cuscuta campestris TaxID=132261 RepID=A0A484KXN5_9ASTE|nr:unnamed protein product [Cuscuta campestris]
MLSLSVNIPKPPSLSSTFLPSPPPTVFPKPVLSPRPIAALIFPPSPGQNPPERKQLYQPFRPPPSPVPSKYRSLDTNSRLEILTKRLGPWFEYAPLIPSLIQEGFAPSTLEEIAGISGAEQNLLVVASRVRESLLNSGIDAETLSFFDSGGGAELLYEIRILTADQRAAAADFLVKNRSDVKQSQRLARAMKDFRLRRADRGWARFDPESPGDCLAFSYFRQAKEYEAASKDELRRLSLQKALEFAVSDAAKALLEEEKSRTKSEEKESNVEGHEVTVPLVRMQLGEVAESSALVVLPVAVEAEEVEAAPWNCIGVGEFGIVEAEKEWRRWVVLPEWKPISGLHRGGAAVRFENGRILPWKESEKNQRDPILVVADRRRKEVVSDNGFYLVFEVGNGSSNAKLKVERGGTLKENGVEESLGMVVLVVRAPMEGDNGQLSDESWE